MIAYVPKMLVTTSFPSSKLNANEYVRSNGRCRLTMLAPGSVGLPYGTYPRLITSWIATEAKIRKSRELYLGRSLNAFMKTLGKSSTGGANGSISAFREQCKRLFSTSISWIEETEGSWSIENFRIADKATLLWESRNPGRWDATLNLEEKFFEDVLKSAVPVDLRVLQACSHFPLAFDLYCWLTYRYFSLSSVTVVRWDQLEAQFGNVYSNRSSFKRKFVCALERVRLFYPAAKFSTNDIGLRIYPSMVHVPVLKRASSLSHGKGSCG